MAAQLIRYEFRRLGLMGFLTPALVASLFCGLALLMTLGGADKAQVARVLVAGLELGLPLAAGVVATGIAADEPAIDLQLALFTRYRTTLLRRLALLVAWTSLFCLVWSVALRLSGLWNLWVQEPFPVGQLLWVSPLLWFVAVGAAAALVFGGRSVGGALLGGLWTFEIVFRGLFIGKDWLRPEFLFATTFAPGAYYWLSNRLALISTALVVGLAVWLLSSRTEALAKGGEA